MLYIRNSLTPVPYVHHADSHPACNFRADVLDPKNALDIVQHFLCPTMITRAAALPRDITYI
jgi:hypothetical protein